MDHNQPEQDNLKKRILQKIESDDVTMHSGAYFATRTAAAVVVSFAVLLLTIFICNFIVFSIRIAGHNPFARSDATELALFLKFFPWPFLLLDIALMVLLRQLLKHFRFGYLLPAVYVFLILIAATISVSLFLDEGIHLNDRLLEHAHRHELPQPLNVWYESVPSPNPTYLPMAPMGEREIIFYRSF